MKSKQKYWLYGILALAIVGIVLISGCAEKECKTNEDCLTKTCFISQCMDNKCVYSSITNCCGNKICEVGETYPECAADCPNCDDNNDCTNDSYDYHEQKCVNAPIPNVICCGNGVCELRETYISCTKDCPDCDDENECTEDSYGYHEQKCINELIIPCCGNDICDEGAEDYSSCTADCPDCDDNNRLTRDSFNYATQECEYIEYYYFEDFNSGATGWPTDSKKGPDPRWVIVFPEDETNGVLTKIDEAESAFSNFGDRSWTDYTFRYKAKLEEGVVIAYVRAKFGQEGAYGISVSKAHLTLFKDIEGPGSPDLESKEYSFEVNQFYDIKIEAKSNNLKVYVDDNLEIDYTDTDNPILSGNVGLEIIKNGYFDDIIVEAP